MTQKVSIGVSADLDASAIERKLNELGQKIAQSNKLTFSPIQNSSLEDLDKMLKQFEQLQRVQGDLRRRMRDTGQSERSLINVDWDQLYADPASRARQMRKAFEYSTGATFHEPVPQPARPDAPTRPSQAEGGGRTSPSGGGLGGMGVNVAQAGLRAAGPVGGVAAGALGTGMAAGFGAGLMGLLGGLAALGVGKLVGAATENIGKAEDNSVALDRLKRTIGDVNISFDGLKSVVNGSANDLKITYAESIKLSSEFAKLSNLTADQSNEISDELKTGVGFARSYGLDPSQGVGVLGQMRGIGVTTNAQESRRFALLIGEAIAKSDAFSKADEVMEAISNYATMQTRAGMGVANVGGFAGMFSGMVGSGIPGLDPSGAGALLMRINASLAAGGAKGEASQFFTGMLGGRMGLTPFETEVMREGGAFATGDEAFGPDSIYARYMGRSGPAGDATWLNQSLDQLRSQYGGNREQLAQATANHLGISNRQAMALLSINPNEMGEMMQYAPNLAGLSASGIGNMSKALYGSDGDRADVANALYRNRDLTSADRIRLDEAMKGGDADVQRQLLAELSAQYGQERTQGSDIRDSKNALDNIKTSIADKLVPIALEMRHGIMSLAGVGDGVSSEDVMERVIRADSKSRERSILGRHDPAIAALEDEREELMARTRLATPERLQHTYRDRPEIIEEKLREREENLKRLVDVEAELAVLNEKKKAALQEEETIRESQLRQMRESMAAQREMDAERQRSVDILAQGGSAGGAPYSAAGGGSGGASSGRFMGSRPSGGSGGANGNVQKFVQEYGPLAQRVADELGVPVEAVLGQWGLETGWGKSVIPGTNNLGNIKDFSGKGPRAKDNMTGSVDSYRAYGSVDGFGDDFIELLKNRRYSGVRGAQTPEDYFGVLKDGGYAEDPNYVNKGVAAANAARRAMNTPMPGDAQRNESERNAAHVTVEPLEVIHRNEKGQEVAPPQTLNTRVQSNWGR